MKQIPSPAVSVSTRSTLCQLYMIKQARNQFDSKVNACLPPPRVFVVEYRGQKPIFYHHCFKLSSVSQLQYYK